MTRSTTLGSASPLTRRCGSRPWCSARSRAGIQMDPGGPSSPARSLFPWHAATWTCCDHAGWGGGRVVCVCVCLRMCVCTCACACVYMGGIFTTDDADDVGTSMCVTVCMCLLALLTGLCLGVCVCASNPCVCVCVCACVPPGTHPVPGHRDWVTLLPPPLQSLIRYWVTLPPPGLCPGTG